MTANPRPDQAQLRTAAPCEQLHHVSPVDHSPRPAAFSTVASTPDENREKPGFSPTAPTGWGTRHSSVIQTRTAEPYS